MNSSERSKAKNQRHHIELKSWKFPGDSIREWRRSIWDWNLKAFPQPLPCLEHHELIGCSPESPWVHECWLNWTSDEKWRPAMTVQNITMQLKAEAGSGHLHSPQGELFGRNPEKVSNTAPLISKDLADYLFSNNVSSVSHLYSSFLLQSTEISIPTSAQFAQR